MEQWKTMLGSNPDSSSAEETCVRHVIPLISTVTRHISNSDTAYARDIPWKKRTGRGYANDLMFRDLRHFTLANKKCFTRTMARLVGVDSSLERT
ncbi:unnamed protein product, partial [Thelazia callipaeda]|uniref:Uncharacterized protein n=1 Tax=Thelazia callipaeda TaxID=103827 RepID=A0A0N5CTX1_THECL